MQVVQKTSIVRGEEDMQKTFLKQFTKVLSLQLLYWLFYITSARCLNKSSRLIHNTHTVSGARLCKPVPLCTCRLQKLLGLHPI